VSPHRTVVAAGRALTAGASFAHADLMLALIACSSNQTVLPVMRGCPRRTTATMSST
jgi:hypothetical protein